MRSAPAVQIVVSRHGAWRVAQAALHALTAALLATWLTRRGAASASLSLWVPTALALAVGAVAWRRVSGLPERLRWDGSVWQFEPAVGAALAGQAAVMIDLGGWMLVRFKAEAGRLVVWRALSRGVAAGDWHGLRAALFAARTAPTAQR